MSLIYFKDTDSGAPALSGQAGKMLGLLDAALIVNHVFSTTNDSSFTDNSVEARLEAGTAFPLFITPASGDRTYIGMPCKFDKIKLNFATAGAGGTIVWEYWNGSAWTAIVSPTDGTSGLTTNGTISWSIASQTGWATTAVNGVTQYWVRVRASANPSTNPTANYLTVGGWTRAYSGTNKAAYRQGTGSNGFLLRVDDTGTTQARTVGYESMTDVDTGTAPFPTAAQFSGGMYFNKSNTADATARAYAIAATVKLFHYHCNASGTASQSAIHSFGDLKSYKSGDAFGTFHLAATSAAVTTNNSMNQMNNTGNTSGHYLARTYTQLGTSITSSKQTDSGKQGSITQAMGSAGLTYPHPVDGGLYLAPVFIHESASVVRGELPGIWAPLHNQPLAHLDTFSGSGTLAGKTFIALTQYSGSQAFLETSDTWNT